MLCFAVVKRIAYRNFILLISNLTEMKRWIFFISYILFFTVAPIGVYYLWPVNVPSELLDGFGPIDYSDSGSTYYPNANLHHINADSTKDSINPYLSIDLHWQDSMKR